MRFIRLLFLSSLCAGLLAVKAAPANHRIVSSSFLGEVTIQRALAQIETGHLKNPDHTRGPSGEVSRYQIMPSIWRDYSKSRNYSNPHVAWNVAYRILKDRYAWFVRSAGREPSAFDLYVMWNKPGLYSKVGFKPGRLPVQLRDVARRFENLVVDMRDSKAGTEMF